MAQGHNGHDRNELWVGKPHSTDLPTHKTQVDSATARLYEEVSRGIVLIKGDDSRGTATGSGAVIDTQGHVATDAHVALAMRHLSVIAGGKEYQATIEKVDGLHDLAILNVPGLNKNSNVTPLEISTDPLKPGERVYTFGHPLGTPDIVMGPGHNAGRSSDKEFVNSDERAFILRNDHGSKDFLQRETIKSDAFVLPGNSGGPLVNKQGKIVGLADAMGTSGKDFMIWSLSTPSKFLTELQSLPSKYQFDYQKKHGQPFLTAVHTADNQDRTRACLSEATLACRKGEKAGIDPNAKENDPDQQAQERKWDRQLRQMLLQDKLDELRSEKKSHSK